jgi:hypothetical protein
MNHYQISAPRAVFAIGAVAMTAITIAFAVVVPAQIQSGDHNTRTLASSETPAPVTATADRLHVEVVGVREPELISVRARGVLSKRKQDS